jgi:hypothetical protein
LISKYNDRIVGPIEDKIEIISKNGTLSFSTILSFGYDFEQEPPTIDQIEFKHNLKIKYRDVIKDMLNLVTKVQSLESSLNDVIKVVSDSSSLVCRFHNSLDLNPLLKQFSMDFVDMETEDKQKIHMSKNEIIVFGLISDKSAKIVKDLFVFA